MKTIKISVTILVILLTQSILLPFSTPVSAGSDATVYVTAQSFVGGRMYWRSDTGLIWVISNSGRVYTYPVSSYTSLPDNPYFNPPAGFIRPINGFGKIWGSNMDVHNRFGWATTNEIGFYTRIVTQGALTYLVELDQKIIQINPYPNGVWQVVSSIPNPPPNSPQILSFTAQPNPVSPGGTLSVSWQVTGVELVILEFYSGSSIPFTLLQDLPISGTSEVTIPASASGSVTITIWAANRWHYYSPVPLYQRLIQQTITVSVQGSSSGAHTGYAQAAYQKYERGFLLWRADTGAVLAFWNSGSVAAFPQSTYGTLPDNPIAYVPASFVRPINGFGKVWGNYSYVRDGLGYALGPEEAYTLTIQTDTNGRESYRLPDGRWVYLTGPSAWKF